jgi:hypothetical protein
MNHQQLLDNYAAAQRAVIMEHSGDFSRDMRKLHDEIKAYAQAYGLTVPEEVFEGFLEDWNG